MSRFTDAIRTFRKDPVVFVTALMGIEPLEWQAKVLRAVARGDRRVSIRSGRRVGKTSLMAWLSLWFEMVFADAKTIVTAPSSAQLDDAYVPNFRHWARKLPDDLYAMWNIKAEKFEWRPIDDPPYENFVTIRTARADSPESLQGINATNVLVLVDESAGVEDINFEALSGSLATGESDRIQGRAHMVLTGNPNRASGYFYKTHHELSDHWTTFHVNSETCEIVGREWIEEKRDEWGRDSNAYRVHVLGEFPLDEEDTLIPFHLVQAAIERDVQIHGPMLWGVDVGGFGASDTTLVKRRKNGVVGEPLVWHGLDTMQVTGRIKHEWDECDRYDERPVDILIDSNGIGSGVADRLRELGLPARSINVSESPALKDKHNRLRDELWDECRQWFERRDVSLPDDHRLLRELTAPRVGFTSSGKLKVESKKDMKKRGIGSPDLADALVLTFASNAATAAHGRHGQPGKALKRNIRGIV